MPKYRSQHSLLTSTIARPSGSPGVNNAARSCIHHTCQGKELRRLRNRTSCVTFLSARRNDNSAHLGTQTMRSAFLCSRTRRSGAHLGTQTESLRRLGRFARREWLFGVGVWDNGTYGNQERSDQGVGRKTPQCATRQGADAQSRGSRVSQGIQGQAGDEPSQDGRSATGSPPSRREVRVRFGRSGHRPQCRAGGAARRRPQHAAVYRDTYRA